MGCSHSVPQVGKPHKISPISSISKYSPAVHGGEFKFKRSRSGSIDTLESSRLESRDSRESSRIHSGRKAFGSSADSHIVLSSLDELDQSSAPFARNKPIVITAALKQALILEHIKAAAIAVQNEEKSRLLEECHTFIPSLQPSIEDVSCSGDFSVDLVNLLEILETPPPLAYVAPEPMSEVDPDYVHIDRSSTSSCFAVQHGSWYTAPRPYLRVQVIEFKWW